MAKDSILISGAEKGRLMVSRSLIRFGISATIIFLLSGILSGFEVFRDLFKSYFLLAILLSSLTGSIAAFGFFFLLFTDGSIRWIRYVAELKTVKIIYWLVTVSLAISISTLSGVLGSLGLISGGGLLLSFAIPSSFFVVAGFLTKYTNIDFTKLDFPIFIFSIAMILPLIIILYIFPSKTNETILLSLVLILWVGTTLSELSNLKKHKEYIEITSSNDGIYGKEEERFSILHSLRLTYSFASMVRILLWLLSRR